MTRLVALPLVALVLALMVLAGLYRAWDWCADAAQSFRTRLKGWRACDWDVSQFEELDWLGVDLAEGGDMTCYQAANGVRVTLLYVRAAGQPDDDCLVELVCVPELTDDESNLGETHIFEVPARVAPQLAADLMQEYAAWERSKPGVA